ncbi:M42 family metallopeptidase [Cryomorphaceae bacterium]|nr:M42 family metallopeptidase [Cryomorphaceae bacterium]
MIDALNIDLLSEVCMTPGAPGYESRIRDLVLRELEGHADEVRIDNMGNVVAVRKGRDSSKKWMVTAHMDEIGFIVTHIDDRGFVRFHTLGGFDPKTLTAQRVIVHGRKDLLGVMGSKPIHVMSPEERNKVTKIKDHFIDLGLPKEEVEKHVRIGDTITRERDLVELGDNVCCKSIDNRVSVYMLLETMKNVQNPAHDLYGVFTVQEEVGLRGAHVSAHDVEPDFGINLDTTVAYDLPGAGAHERITSMGAGAGVKVMDSGTICDYRMVDYLRGLAEKHEINHQMEVLTAGGTDTAGVQRMTPGGSIAGAISIPTRYLHQVIEMASKQDILDSLSLLKVAIEGLDEYDWSF